MNPIVYKRASKLAELEQIIALQKNNISLRISLDEKRQEGFVTVQHTLALLEQMNQSCPHVVAKSGDKVVGYALVMLSSFRKEVEVLVPMFEKIDSLVQCDTTYVVMGQICVAKEYRKQGIFRGLYQFYRNELQHEFDCLITEVAAINLRSMQAHEAVGFKTIDNYEEEEINWNIMLWDWT
jgi:L-amino acid N-acyltransferase YncA